MSGPSNLRAQKPHELGRSLVDCLTSTVDSVRHINTELGLRAYRVFLVWVAWTADEDGNGWVRGKETLLDDQTVGVGRGRVVKEVEILPPPRVSLAGVAENYDAVGLTERGSIMISEISLSYSERVLRGLLPEFEQPNFPETLKDGVEFFWEVQGLVKPGLGLPGTAGGQLRDNQPAIRRRFHLTMVPTRDPSKFEWRVNLSRADGDRQPGGGV